MLDGAGVGALWRELLVLLVIGAITLPLGVWIFLQFERYAKRAGLLKRSG